MNWGFVGCGNLAQAIISGVISQNILKPSEIFAADRSAEKLDHFAESTKIQKAYTIEVLLKKCDIVVLATKPQDMGAALEEVSLGITPVHTVVSLAAGVTAKALLKALPACSGLIRVMANTPAQIQKGAFGIYEAKASPYGSQEVRRVFEGIGINVPLKSDKEVDAVTSASASGAGFVLLFMESFETWLIKKGLSKENARALVLKTFEGTALLAQARPDQTLAQLRETVTSKKGTTFEGLQTFRKTKVPQSIQKALEAAFKRASQLSKLLK